MCDTQQAGFQKEVLFFEAEPDGHGGYFARYLLPQGHGASRIRLDPVEYQGCILTDLSICQNGKKLPMIFGQSIRMDEDVCLLGNDPAVYADIGPGEVKLRARMVLAGAEYERIMQDRVVSLQEQKLRDDAHQRELQNRITQLQADLRDYMILAEQKEKYILAMKLRTTPLGVLRHLFPRVFQVAKSLARRILGILGRRNANG